MRFKIKAPDDQTYRELHEKLRAKNIKIWVASEKYLMFSTEALSASVILYIKNCGATVNIDHQYSMEII